MSINCIEYIYIYISVEPYVSLWYLLRLVSKTLITLMMFFYNYLILNITCIYINIISCPYMFEYFHLIYVLRSLSYIIFDYGMSNEIITQKIIVIRLFNL
jgi:hypothetical protein